MVKKIKLETEIADISIQQFEEDCTWKEIMCYVIDCIKGLGYHSTELEELQEKWM